MSGGASLGPHLHGPAGSQASHAQAVQLFQAGLLAQAEQICKTVLTQTPDDGPCWHLMGHIRGQLQDLQGAQFCMANAARACPEDPAILADWGNSLRKLMQPDAALRCYELALQLKPDAWQVHYNQANTLRDLRRNPEAVESYRRAIALKPDLAHAYANLGNALRDVGQHQHAKQALEKALLLDPALHAARYNLGLCELDLQEFESGWAHFDARWAMPDFANSPKFDRCPHWSSERPGQRLLIWAEQGLGDEIFWAGLLGQAHTLAPEVWVQADARLVSLLSRSFPLLKWVSGRDNFSPHGFDTQMPMGSLGRIFRKSLRDFEQTQSPFLQVDELRSAAMRQMLNTPNKRLCGVSWRSLNPRTGADKSLSLLDLLPVLRLPGWTFVNLQYGDVSSEVASLRELHGIDLLRCETVDNFQDVDGLAHLIKACDAVVTTSNSTAHLAGALAQKTLLMAPGGRGRMWYWMNRRGAHSLWYPTIRFVEEAGWDQTHSSDAHQSIMHLVQDLSAI